MRDISDSLRNKLLFTTIAGFIAYILHSLLPKNLKTIAMYVVIFIIVFASCCWISERRRRRREEDLLWNASPLKPHCDLHANGGVDAVLETSDVHQGRKLFFIQSKSADQIASKKNRYWTNLPRFWELFSFILPCKSRRECFEPAYNDFLEKYVRAREFRGKWARRWIAFAFIILFLFMIADCIRVLFQSGAGKILLGLLPEQLRTWWRRQ
jgi:hypothetical protein